MDAVVQYQGPNGPIMIMLQAPGPPPPKLHTFTDPSNGAVVEAEYIEDRNGVPLYREVGMPPPPELPEN